MAISGLDSLSTKILPSLGHIEEIQGKTRQLKKKKIKRSVIIEREILSFLLRTGNQGKIRSEISGNLKFPRTTVFDALKRLQNRGLIETEFIPSKTRVGRPQTIYFVKGIIRQES